MKRNVLSSLYGYYTSDFGYLMEFFFKHLLMFIYGVLFAYIIGTPVGILIARYSKIAWPVITIANIIRTVPAITMLAILMLASGLGPPTVVSAVFLCTLLPTIKNTYIGITEVDYNTKDAGKGIGMINSQVMRMIELPLSLSVIIDDIRIALVVAIGTIAIDSFIGAPTLGDIIIRGTNSTNGTVFVLAGAIPTALIAILIGTGLHLLEKKLDPTRRSSKQVQSLR